MSAPIAYDVAGSGPLLVLIHGITESRHSWDSIDLTASFRVIRVDLRGHGESPTDGEYSIVSLATDVHDVVVEVAGADAAPLVVGHSMGGIVATAYGAIFPAAGIVNVDQALALGGMQQQVKQWEPMLRGDSFDAVMNALFEDPALPDAEVARLNGIRDAKQQVVLGMWAPLLTLPPEELDALVAELTDLPVDLPYLAIIGVPLGDEYADWLRSQITSAEVEVWAPPVTHYPHLADPARFIARIEAFAATLG